MQFLLQFPPNRRQVASSFEHVPNLCDIAVTNRTEIAGTKVASAGPRRSQTGLM